MLDIADLTKSYGELLAVNDVSLSVARGRIVGFVGPNGAGKSTTMRSIFGLVEPDAGSIHWDGSPVTHAHLSRFGYMPEQRGLYPKMRIQEQVAFFAQLKGVERKEAGRRAGDLLDSLGLGDRLNDPLEKLSHGNQQRVQLAVSLVNDPELLVLDEPFNGLDPVAVNTLQDVLEERVANGSGALFSSHQLDLVERICDEIVIIVNGSIQASGSVADVRASTGQRHLTVTVDRPLMPLADAIDRPLVSSSTSEAVMLIDSDEQLDQVLTQARSVGMVTRFDYDLPSLQEVFTHIADDANQPTAANEDVR